ncbi:MAG: UPF0223 family protein [Lactobacillales bacterium]|jgi:uncharacterized protein YktA (UPF0223 family)|nr:UPF0223 family protein [Lactobacillales bacterium]
MKSEYQYPLDLDWSVDEMIIVTNLWSVLELAYEKGIAVTEFLEKYKLFKEVVRSIGEEKRFGKQFEEASGYSLYRTVQEAKRLQKGRLKMEAGEQQYGRRKK